MITDTQRLLRRGRIGSSDAAAICGIDPYRSPADVWAVMTERAPPFAGNQATLAGTFMERGVLDWFETETGKTLQRDLFIEHADGIRAANLDGLTIGQANEIAEAKTCGILFPAKMRDEYGDPEDGMEGVPEHVIIQTHHQASVIEPVYGRVEAINVVALIGMRGFVHYRFATDWTLADAIAERVVKFYDEHVTRDIQPDGGISAGVARELKRVKGKTVPVNPVLVENWRRCAAIAKEAEKALEDAKGQVLAALGDAEAGTSKAGNLTYYQQSRAGYTVEPTTFRQLRFKKPL